jgi:hypothetical protein
MVERLKLDVFALIFIAKPVSPNLDCENIAASLSDISRLERKDKIGFCFGRHRRRIGEFSLEGRSPLGRGWLCLRLGMRRASEDREKQREV